MSLLNSGITASITSGLKNSVQKGVTAVDRALGPAARLLPNFLNPRSSLNSDPLARLSGNPVVSKVQFPQDLGRYYLSMKFHEYTRPTVFAKTQIDTTDFIAMPLPSEGFNDTYVLGYKDGENHGVSGFVNETVTAASRGNNTVGAIGNDVKNVVDSLPGAGAVKDLMSQLPDSVKNLGDAGLGAGIASLIAQAQGTGLGSGGLQLLGMAENPYLTVLFTGPQFKEHRFRWLLSPKNPAESTALTTIVNTFKKGAHPEVVSGIGAFRIPKVLHIQIKPDEAAQHMYSFKPCVITSIDVNYHPAGPPAFFAGTSAPVQIELSIGLKEIEIWTQTDFKSELVQASAPISNTAVQQIKNIADTVQGTAIEGLF